MLGQLRDGDVIIIWKLDRLARSLKDLVSLVNEIQEKGAGLHSLNDHIDTSTPNGKLTFHLFAALAESETTTYMVAMKAAGDEFDVLADALLVPAIMAFTPTE